MTQTITELTAHQYKGIIGTATIRPNGPGLYVIAGPNGSGKSSFLGGIEEIFEPGGIKGTPKPIHEGETEAYLECVTSKARLRKTFREGKPVKFEAFALDGAKYASGTKWVAEATGGQVFNTRHFNSMADKDQRQLLLGRVDLPFDLAALDAEYAAAFAGRTDATREAKRLAAVVAAMPTAPAGTPAEEVSSAAVREEAAAARAHNDAVEAAEDAAISAEDENLAAIAEVERLTEALDAAKTYATRTHEAATSLVAVFRKAGQPIEMDAIFAKLESADQINTNVRAAKMRASAEADRVAAEKVEADLNAKLAEISKTKADGLKAAKFPVDGLGIDDTGITFNGIPFKQQVNSGQQIVIAFDLATSEQPDLRIVFIEDGDLLDSVSLAGIRKIAEERGYYVFAERDRDDSREIGAVFTAGELAL
jgi:ABC-type cobalamin/Fe3+-siderophores transport system ATPase subunit